MAGVSLAAFWSLSAGYARQVTIPNPDKTIKFLLCKAPIIVGSEEGSLSGLQFRTMGLAFCCALPHKLSFISQCYQLQGARYSAGLSETIHGLEQFPAGLTRFGIRKGQAAPLAASSI